MEIAYKSEYPSGLPGKGSIIHAYKDGNATLCGVPFKDNESWYTRGCIELAKVNCAKCKKLLSSMKR